ncbi:WD40 repeat domain-containing protein [Actinorugispora endophytica]|uniref:Ribosome assembly protein 4 (RSA4) n=1 Tax=Actinorugispora endophytica TaxID=1605990 RepID=A0A4R6V522_9ACTN|nr:WD40 repeat domain-containing protein [Actinorugispora endophytica]TDQ55404.1 ribosome assembly protein 4 (RSA4) [Actinorugispora endophytica]
MRRRQRLGLLLQLFLVLAASLLGVVTNYATNDGNAPFPLNILERAALPGLALLLVALVIGHFVAYRLENPPDPELTWDRSRIPFPGLEAFNEDEAAVFFGRDVQISEVVRRLHESGTDTPARFVTVVGASGSGKSSLVQAGVLPRLRAQRWMVLRPIVPGTDPLGALARSLSDVLDESVESVSRRLRRSETELASLLARARREKGRRLGRTLLVIDQLEELASLSGERDRNLFLASVTEALRRDRHLRVVATLRVEFLGDLLSGEHSRLFTSPVAIGAIDRAGLAEVIERPASLAGLRLEPGLIERIVADTGSGDALPLLAYLLQELYLSVGAGRTATLHDYAALGGVGGALSRHADQVVAELRDDGDPAEVLRVLLLFVTVTSEDATRRRVPLGSLEPAQRRIVDAFVDARLLVSDVHDGSPTAQVTHEALFRQWAPLRQEVRTHAERLRQRAELERWAADWERSERSPDYLLGGQRLALAEQWLDGLRQVGQETSELVAFVEASKRRDQGFLLRVSKGIAEYVLANVEQYPELAVLLSLAALSECAPTPVVQRALMAALSFSHGRLVLKGHTDTVRNIAWSPDGTMIATASRDGTARVWDAETGETTRDLTGHLGMVEMVAWSPDSTRLATASRDRTVRLWDVATGESTTRFADATDVVRGVAWSPDGRWIAGASRDRVVRVWEVATGRLSASLVGHEDNVLGIKWSPDGDRLATASHDQNVIVWDIISAKPQLVLRGHQDFVEGVDWSPDGRSIATASGDHTVRVWDASDGRQSLLIRGHRDRVWNVVWSPDGKSLATASADRTARVFSASDADEKAVLRGHDDGVWGVAWSPDGRRLVTGSEDGTARVWDLIPQTVERKVHTSHTASVTSVRCVRDWAVIVSAAEDGTVRLGGLGENDGASSLHQHGGKIRAVACSPDGQRLVSCGIDRRGVLWFVGGERQPVILDHDSAIVESAAWSPDGTRLATGAQDRSIRIWDAFDGSLLTVLTGHQDWVVGLDWSPGGGMIASSSDDRTARVWDLSTGRERFVLHGHDNWVDSVSWSPDESHLVTSSADWTARIWNISTGTQSAVLRGHEGRVPCVSWSPDGTRIATGSYDRTVRLWEPRDGSEIGVIGMHRDRVTCVDWTSDARSVVSGSFDTTVRVWPAEVDLERLQLLARRRVFRSLTVEERRAHMLAVAEDGQ